MRGGKQAGPAVGMLGAGRDRRSRMAHMLCGRPYAVLGASGWPPGWAAAGQLALLRHPLW